MVVRIVEKDVHYIKNVDPVSGTVDVVLDVLEVDDDDLVLKSRFTRNEMYREIYYT